MERIRWLAIALCACSTPPPTAANAAPRAPIAPHFDPLPENLLESDLEQISLRGLPAHSTVSIVAERPVTAPAMFGGARHLHRAQATFVVGDSGELALASARPEPGSSYRGADLRGLFWSMAETADAAPDGWTDDQVHLTARAGDRELAHTTLTLRSAAPDVAVTPADADLPGAFLARRPGAGKQPVVILLGGSEGGDSFARRMAPQLASRGYAVLGLPYYAPAFGAPSKLAGLPSAFIDIPVDRLERARAWLARQPGVDADRLALYGVSKGAEFALIAATRFPWIRAVIAIVPSDVVWEGWGIPGAAPGTRSSFAWRGEPLPFVPYDDMAGEFAKAQRGERVALRIPQDRGRAKHPEAVARARIPIEQFKGALLLAGGGDDQVWASAEMTVSLASRRGTLPTTPLVFPAAGHVLSGDGWAPLTGLEKAPFAVGGTAEANAHAQVIVWRETLAFLARSLGK